MSHRECSLLRTWWCVCRKVEEHPFRLNSAQTRPASTHTKNSVNVNRNEMWQKLNTETHKISEDVYSCIYTGHAKKTVDAFVET